MEDFVTFPKSSYDVAFDDIIKIIGPFLFNSSLEEMNKKGLFTFNDDILSVKLVEHDPVINNFYLVEGINKAYSALEQGNDTKMIVLYFSLSLLMMIHSDDNRFNLKEDFRDTFLENSIIVSKYFRKFDYLFEKENSTLEPDWLLDL